jgi:RNA polymerase sigma-70 factor, ECF subfamily
MGTIKDMTFSDVDALDTQAGEADVAFEMDEEAFRAFYDRTARALWLYLSRITGDSQQADDLLQETYYRFLRAKATCQGENHRRAYLFRIATNLVRDGYRQTKGHQLVELPRSDDVSMDSRCEDLAEVSARRTDLHRAMARLRPRDRALLWLAYAQGHAHVEIAETLGVKPGSIKLLLFRARRRLAELLRGAQGGRTRGTR